MLEQMVLNLRFSQPAKSTEAEELSKLKAMLEEQKKNELKKEIPSQWLFEREKFEKLKLIRSHGRKTTENYFSNQNASVQAAPTLRFSSQTEKYVFLYRIDHIIGNAILIVVAYNRRYKHKSTIEKQ